MEAPSFDPTRTYQYFNFDFNDPGAIVILNRGTEFEVDITNDIRSATTSNSVESIAGSFSIVLDNTNDSYVDRFGYTHVKVMSSIEIFAKSLSAQQIDNNLSVGFDSVQIPQSVKSLTTFVNTYYNNPEPQLFNTYRDQILTLNKDRVTPSQTYTVNTATNGLNGIKSVSVTSSTIKMVFNDPNIPPFEIIYHTIISQNYPNIVFTIFPEDIGKITTPYHNINMANIINATATAQPDPILISDFSLGEDSAGQDRMNNLRLSPIRIPVNKSLYQRIFLGVILNVSQNINPGAELTLNLTGKSVGYWLEATPVNVFPGGFEVVANNVDLTNYANRYAATHAMDIFRDLIRFSTDDLVAVTDFNLGNIGTTQDVLELNGTINQPQPDMFGNPVKVLDENGNETDITSKYQGTRPSQQFNQLSNQLELAYQGFPTKYTSNPNNNVTNGTNDSITKSSTWTRTGNAYTTAKNSLASAQAKLTALLDAYDSQINAAPNEATRAKIRAQKQTAQESGNAKISSLNDAVVSARSAVEAVPEFQQNQTEVSQNQNKLKQDIARLTKAGRSNILNQVGIIDHWKQVFASMVLEVVDNNNFLNLVFPFKWTQGDPGPSMDGDYITKADLARTIAENLMYEFYCDTNGHFILKPPLYNIGIPDNNSDYIIEEVDLISLAINESVEGIITRIGVTGDWVQFPGSLEKFMIYNIHQDLNLIRDYGFHAQEIANRVFLTSNEDCRDFGKSYMTKNNMELYNCSVTINGRPEIRLGTTVYLKPRDTMFYVKEINHEITAGGQFQTTLNLVGGRRIVTGFKAQTEMNTIVKNTTSNPTAQTPGIKFDKKQTIHYILSNSVNQYAVTDPNNKTAGVQFNREQELSAQQKNAMADNPNSQIFLGQSIDPNDVVNQKAIANGFVPQILRNVYQITTHIDPAFIGLIVDRDSQAISSINEANYNFFAKMTVESVQDSLKNLNIPKNKQKIAVDTIIKFFNTFAQQADHNFFGQPTQFTLSLRDQFILYFLSSTSAQIKSSTVTGSTNSQAVNTSSDNLAAACTLFNQLVNQLDNNGIYRQFTDDDGRELPAYLDYGKSLLIQNNQITVAEFTNLNEVSNAQKQQAEAVRKATKAAQITSPDKTSNINDALKFSLSQIAGSNQSPAPVTPNATFVSTTPTAGTQ